MPLYDVICLFKTAASRKEVVEIMASVGKRVYARNGVVTDITSYGLQPLGYQIKRQGTRFDEAQLMQMTFMAPTAMVDELQVLQQDDRLLRHTVLKHKPFWKEEVIDNQLWTQVMDMQAPFHSDDSGEMEASIDAGADERLQEMEDEDLEFAADEVDEADLHWEAPEISTRRLSRRGESGRARRVEASSDERRAANDALEKWRMMFRERQRNRSRTAGED